MTINRKSLDILAAPDCVFDGLAATPRVALDAEGKAHISLLDDAGASDNACTYPVEYTVPVPREDLIFVHTRDRIVLMRETDYEAFMPPKDEQNVEQEDRTNDAQDLINALCEHLDRNALTLSGHLLWDASNEFTPRRGDYSSRKRLGLLMAVDALIASPEAVQDALRALRGKLVACDPALALMARTDTSHAQE